jgi:hypothetical protein
VRVCVYGSAYLLAPSFREEVSHTLTHLLQARVLHWLLLQFSEMLHLRVVVLAHAVLLLGLCVCMCVCVCV